MYIQGYYFLCGRYQRSDCYYMGIEKEMKEVENLEEKTQFELWFEIDLEKYQLEQIISLLHAVHDGLFNDPVCSAKTFEPGLQNIIEQLFQVRNKMDIFVNRAREEKKALVNKLGLAGQSTNL